MLRLSTVTLTALSAVALYSICLELGASRHRAALAVTAYLVNPLTFVLSFSYMTDPHVAALTLIAAAFYLRGLRRGKVSEIVVGSAVASVAFLSRSTGVAVAVGACAYALFHRKWRHALASVALPILVAIGTAWWFANVHGVPLQQRQRTDQVINGLGDLGRDWEYAKTAAFLAVVYIAFSALPILVSGRLRLPRRWESLGVAVLLMAVLLNGLLGRFAPPTKMPYISDWFTPDWLGPIWVLGGDLGQRGPLLPGWGFTALTAVCLTGAVMLAVALCSARGPLAWMTLSVAATLVPSSFVFFPPLDRYLLPVVALGLPLVVATTRGRHLWTGWVVISLVAVLSVVGTRDFLMLNDKVWDVAQRATADGVALDQLDAGWSWDGWHFMEESYTGPVRTPNAPWWIRIAPRIDSTYVVSLAPLPGYRVVSKASVNPWLGSERTVFLLQTETGRG